MLRIGICDDIYDARLVLRAALERVLEKRRVQGQFREFSSGEGLLRWLESHAGELEGECFGSSGGGIFGGYVGAAAG